VGAFVLNENREVLVVSEKRGPAAKTDFRLYKLPTGLVDLGEDVPDAAQREVREETGIDTEFVAVLGMRHAHQVAFGRGDMFFLCALRPVGDRIINMCDTELIDAKVKGPAACVGGWCWRWSARGAFGVSGGGG